MWNCRKPRTAKILLKKYKVGRFTLSANKTYNKALITTTVWYWHKSRRKLMDRRETPPKKPQVNNKDSTAEQCGVMIFWINSVESI